jgi:hypothetical protein
MKEKINIFCCMSQIISPLRWLNFPLNFNFVYHIAFLPLACPGIPFHSLRFHFCLSDSESPHITFIETQRIGDYCGGNANRLCSSTSTRTLTAEPLSVTWSWVSCMARATGLWTWHRNSNVKLGFRDFNTRIPFRC